MVFLRNYLIAHNDEARKYARLKQKAVRMCKGNGAIYKKLKNKYIKRVTTKAVKASKSSRLR